MMKINSISWMRSKTLCFIPLAALALNASALPKKVSSETIPGNKNAEAVFTDKKESAENDSIYGVMDELPVFPGGDQACANWVAKKLKYPPKCKKEKIEGFVIVQFVVEKNGKVSNVKAIRSPHPDLAEAAVRTVEKMPKWTPGKVGGRAVRSKLNLPVRFRL
jgi:TonB family protein